jgi:hypothetical protein
MTLQLLHSEFPYIWGNFFLLFYQCTREEREGALTEDTVFQVFLENPTFAPPPPPANRLRFFTQLTRPLIAAPPLLNLYIMCTKCNWEQLLKPDSWTYNFVDVSGHNLESSQIWGFYMDFFDHKGKGVWFSVFLLYPVQCRNGRNCKRLEVRRNWNLKAKL